MSDDLGERLVFGDELMTKGDPQGELIVVQCELERGGFDRARGIELRKREVELVRRAQDRLRGTPLEGQSTEFRRGSIDAIWWIDAARFVREEEAIWKLAPELRHVELHGLSYRSSQIGSKPAPSDWTHVRDRVAAVLKSGRIRSLGLIDAWVDFLYPDDFRDESMPPTNPLDLRTEFVSDPIAHWLVETKTIATLRGLRLGGVTPRTLELLATAKAAAQLDALSLGYEPCDEAALGALATTKLAPRRVALDCIREGVVFDRRLTESPFMSSVTDLTVPGLSDFALGRQLKRLSLNVSFEPGWVERLATAPELSGLEELVLARGGNTIGALDARALYEPKHLDSLRVLRIQKGVSVAAARELLRSPLGRRLEVIDHFKLEREPGESLEPHEWDGLVVTHPTH